MKVNRKTYYLNYKKRKIDVEINTLNFGNEQELIRFIDNDVYDFFENELIYWGDEKLILLEGLSYSIATMINNKMVRDRLEIKLKVISRNITGKTIVRQHFRKTRK
jgi:hypothetical protein